MILEYIGKVCVPFSAMRGTASNVFYMVSIYGMWLLNSYLRTMKSFCEKQWYIFWSKLINLVKTLL